MAKVEVVSPGLHVYIGTTGTGKTHLACQHAIALGSAQRRGVLIIDSRGANNLKGLLPIYQVDKKLEEALSQGKVCRAVPYGREEDLIFDRAMDIIDRRGRLVLFIDEVSKWSHNRMLLSLCSVWRHRDISIFLTTQKVGVDIQQGVLSCDPSLYLFRLTSPTALEWVERWHKLTPDRFKMLQVGQHYRLSF